ncbi:KH domain-containing protein [Patescibacteria group bacterium]|nr:KH domain-containing protein [Patescibacteria group bacterium]MBU1123685.1 KH domain-containing protein [Patescibacteria group bacterium]MBU1910817.1 KH domain-containing protein [Patescibacteria group bacterium]
MTADETTPGYAFLKFVLENIVENKEELFIDVKTDDLGVLLTVKVGDGDMGKLIGKNGQTIKALRTLLRIVGGGDNRINLKVLEPSENLIA